MKKSLSETVSQFVKLVTSDAGVESVWLSTLSYLEEAASQQILRSLSESTPAQEREQIISHAADEHRHCLEIKAMIPKGAGDGARYKDLEARMHKIAGNFIMGYFGNSVLVTAKSQHAAYVHAALTIEQFPLQIYTAYLKATQLESVKKSLPTVLRDERAHLALGGRLRDQLSEAELLSLQALQEIEEDMCARMIQRMSVAVLEFLGKRERTGLSDFMSHLARSEGCTVAWIQTLGHAESLAANHMQKIFSLRGLPQPSMMASHVADEMHHCRLMQLSVSGLRRKFIKSPDYVALEQGLTRGVETYLSSLFALVLREFEDPELIYFYGALALETRVFKHYQDIIAATDHIGVSHALSAILVEEGEHTQAAMAALRARGESLKAFEAIRYKEAQLFERTCRNASRLMQAYGGQGFVRHSQLAAAI